MQGDVYDQLEMAERKIERYERKMKEMETRISRALHVINEGIANIRAVQGKLEAVTLWMEED